MGARAQRASVRTDRWHTKTVNEVLQQLGSNSSVGLSERDAKNRFAQYGPNELVEVKARSAWRVLISQFSSTVVLVLVASTVISAALGDTKNVISIGAILVLNALLGFIQERRAERALAALRNLTVPTVKVKRDERVQQISASEIVPGDVVVLEAGNVVPADGRIVESINLQIKESALTGESDSVRKQAGVVADANAPLAERFNMAYAGTFITFGRGLMVITETGMTTELGRIASMIQSVQEDSTPLQRRLNHVGNRLAFAALVIVGVIFALGMLRGENLKLMFLTAMSIAVAAVPEGLPAIVTINLAFGARRMLRRNALIRSLPAVETLGSVSVICTDKTGTLTQNKMTVSLIDRLDRKIDLRNNVPETERLGVIDPVLIAGALCNDAILQEDTKGTSNADAIGDPTETALAVAAARFGLHKTRLEQEFPRVREFSFDSNRKRMTTVHKIVDATEHWGAFETTRQHSQTGSSYAVFSKGSVDSLLSISTHVFIDRKIQTLDTHWSERIQTAQSAFAEQGMRVIGIAYRKIEEGTTLSQTDQSSIEQRLTFIGLVALMDPLRTEVKDAVHTCLAAGIKPVMITGDHPLTANAIARELGFSVGTVLTGAELDQMSPAKLESIAEEISVYARVCPEHKLTIVQALQKRGHIVAMTGDGINDAPALKKADIGVAMGISGTDVAKEASDMVLLDDNFATIIAAIKEGRVIYENIRKSLRYLLTGNVGEIWLMLAAPFIGMPMPLLPVQILWINLITDGIPALALGVEPAGKNVMKSAPIAPNENIFARGMGVQILWLGFLVGLVPLGIGAWYWHHRSPLWQTMIFTTLIVLHVVMALAFRSQRETFFRMPPFSNTPLLGAVLLSIVLQLFVIYTPFFQSFFNTVSLPPKELTICLVLGTSVFWIAELDKWIRRRTQQQKGRTP